jgi:hypothetical protein
VLCCAFSSTSESKREIFGHKNFRSVPFFDMITLTCGVLHWPLSSTKRKPENFFFGLDSKVLSRVKRKKRKEEVEGQVETIASFPQFDFQRLDITGFTKFVRDNVSGRCLLESFFFFGNDPSAGSPTETLLRLLLPLNDQV